MLTRFKNFRLLSTTTIRARLFSTTNSEEDENPIFDREFQEMKAEDFKDLYKDDVEIKKKVEIVLSEYEFIKYNSMGRVPTVINNVEMQTLLDEGHTPLNRDRLFNFFFKREMCKRAAKLKFERKKQETQMRRDEKFKDYHERGFSRTGLLSDNGELIYGLWHNSLFCRIPENRMKLGSSSSRLRDAALFGRKLIFDFGFDDYMVPWLARNAVDQVQEAYGTNRFDYTNPFDLWFCNFNDNSFSGSYCRNKAITNLYSGSMITVKNDCFTNHFDKSQLVYLTPNAKESLGKITKSDDIYIVGVYNDKGHQQPVTYRKALKLGIRVKSLPLDQHIVWQGSSKSLCVNHVAGILLEVMANGGDWQAAFMKYIPKRKIKPLELVAEVEEQRLARLLKRRKSTQFNLHTDLDL